MVNFYFVMFVFGSLIFNFFVRFHGEYNTSLVLSKAGFWGEVRRGAHLPGGYFAPLLKFSAPPLRTFAPPLMVLNEINFKRQLYKLDKKV